MTFHDRGTTLAAGAGADGADLSERTSLLPEMRSLMSEMKSMLPEMRQMMDELRSTLAVTRVHAEAVIDMEARIKALHDTWEKNMAPLSTSTDLARYIPAGSNVPTTGDIVPLPYASQSSSSWRTSDSAWNMDVWSVVREKDGHVGDWCAMCERWCSAEHLTGHRHVSRLTDPAWSMKGREEELRRYGLPRQLNALAV